ncbi:MULTISPECIES: hypothetical protein [Methylicorpusculum]|nr:MULTISPECIES: hypothetical protein [Methylicorpusculum]
MFHDGFKLFAQDTGHLHGKIVKVFGSLFDNGFNIATVTNE